MQKRTLSLSLLIGAALTIPSLAMAVPTNDMTPVEMQTATAENTLENEVESTDGELQTTQPSSFEYNETETISNEYVNDDANEEEMATETEVETVQYTQETVQGQ